jgi:diguanylate cyclase (GGDEF)-like protein/PAS domain S-box-containing protein
MNTLTESLLQAITQSALDGIITSDDAGNIAGWNRVAEDIFDFQAPEVMGQPLTLLVPPRYQQALLDRMTRSRNKGPQRLVDESVELVGRRKNGDEFPMQLALAQWKMDAGWFFSSIVRDLTERKKQEAQIRLDAAVFAQGSEGIIVTDAEGRIIWANKAFTVITGYAESEVVGQNPSFLKSGRQDAEFYRVMWQAIKAEGHWASEIWNRRKDDTVYPERLEISALRNELGKTSHYIGCFSDISDAKAAESRIQWLTHFDALTGLPNRRLLQDRTERAISRAKRHKEALTMMLVAIDQLKSVNDSAGHHVGDALLKETGQRLLASVREQDTVARLGDREFVLLLPNTASNGAAHLATELLRKLALPCCLEGHDLRLTASIGVASYPEDGSDFDKLLKSIEIALHRAQSDGCGRFQFYSDDMYRQVLASEQLISALGHAVTQDQLQLVYQPLVDLQSGQISGMEALVRWQHPELGAVSPARFIPLAEKSGLIGDIGEWVLRRACRDMRNWLDLGIPVPQVAVNVSPAQFRDQKLIAQVKSAIADWRIDPALINIEVTETALMDDVANGEATLRQLKELGLKLSLDDFGTGYSSLSYLKRFPFDKVKIDQSFVRDILSDSNDAVIVNVIISMAHGLGLKVVAEGVETEAQCEFLRTSVCDEIQGYFFSRPISATAIEDLFKQGRQLPAHLLRLQKPQRTLLLVDDEPNILSALKRLLRRDGHLILTANSGPEGLAVLAEHKVDIIISDQRMPGMTGVEFLRAAKVNHPDTIRIVLSGYTELQSVTDAINEGAIYRFLTKPWEDHQLREHIQKAFEHKELMDENHRLDIKIRTTNRDLLAANRQLGELLILRNDQIERDETSLAIAREALHFVPAPVLGVDDSGLIALANPAAEALFARECPLLGMELAGVLPAVDAMLATVAEGDGAILTIDHTSVHVKWNAMGLNSHSRGKLITFTTQEAQAS